MTLAAGQTLSQYEILGPLGAGGMGEVWRARDPRLAREVAIKVLPADVAADPDRLRRFEREARALASLSHPHVAQVYGIDEADGTAFMAMELVPGEDLAERLGRGPLPLDEALDVCRQIAEGLEAAHEAGVVHRDLKPANVRITPDGTVKLLDFGLAKAVGPQPDSGQVSSAEPDSALLTEEGRVLGTPVYMSPEQARGRAVDRRTDLWSLGCVLFECLVGRRPFGGRGPSDVIAAILKDEPDWSALPPLPPRVDELLRRCLRKDARSRLRDAGEARVQLELAMTEPDRARPAGGATTGRVGGPRAAGLVVAGLVVGVLIGLALASGDPSDPAGDGPASAPRRLRIRLTSFQEPLPLRELALSPRADAVAWVDRHGLKLRRFDELADRTLIEDDQPGRIRRVCWSPDGRELAYERDGALWRMPLDGAEPLLICEIDEDGESLLGMAWMEDGRLVTLESGRIVARSVAGGPTEELYGSDAESGTHFDAIAFLPRGAGALLLPHELGGTRDTILGLVDGEVRTLGHYEGWDISDLAWTDGRLFLRTDSDAGARWWWVDCPAEGEGPLGEPEPTPFKSDQAEFGADGTVAWVSQEGEVESQLLRIGLDGAMQEVGSRHTGILIPAPRVADGRRLLFGLTDGSGDGSPIWVHDLQRGVDTFLVEPEAFSPLVVGQADGSFYASSFQPAVVSLFAASGRGVPEPLDVEGHLVDATPDGRSALMIRQLQPRDGTLEWLDLTDDAAPQTVREGVTFMPGSARLSPDGRWALFTAADSGRNQVYLTTAPADGREWQVSVDGADLAFFDEDGDSILLVEGGMIRNQPIRVRRVAFTPGPEPELGLPEPLFSVEDDNLLVMGTWPGGEEFFGVIGHPPVAHDIVVETGWTPEE